MTDLAIDAELRLRTAASLTAVRGLTGQLHSLTSALRGAEAGGDSMFGSLVRFNVLSTGIGMLVNGFSRLTSFATRFSTDLEATRISLSAVMSAVEGESFEAAGERASEVFTQLRDDALRSTATTSELFRIYQSIYGPIRAAGVEMDGVREITNNTVAAANALGVDLAQASRDISMMARGSAGMEVRLFSMLRSTGAIAEDATHFNRLTATERIDRLRSALARFSVAADAYGRSFAGVTSTFRDIVESLTGAAFGPVFERVRRYLADINAYLLAHREQLTDVLESMGERVGRVMDRVADRMREVFGYVNTHWDEISARIQHTVATLAQMLPTLQRAAQAWAAFTISREALAALASISAIVTSVAGFFTPAAAGAAVAAGGAGAAVAGGEALLAGGAVAGGAAAAATAGGTVAAGGAMATLTASLSGLAAAAAPVVAVLAAVGSVVLVVVEYWDRLVNLLGWMEPILGRLWEDFSAIGNDLWVALRPILEIVGALILGGLVVALMALVVVLRVLAAFLRAFTTLLRMTFGRLQPLADAFVGFIFDVLDALALAQLTGAEADRAAGRAVPGLEDISTGIENLADPTDALEAWNADWRRGGPVTPIVGGAPDGRTTVHNDFRGSRITVNQEFREADPDRVALSMVEDLARFAEQRIVSGFVPALTR